MRVRSSIQRSTSSTLNAPSWLRTTRTSTPRLSSFLQGVEFDGNSRSVVTTLSPAFHRKPSATNDNPSDVFFKIAISLGSAPISFAADSRRRTYSAYHARQCSAPNSRCSRAKFSIASYARVDNGPTAAWLKYARFLVTGKSSRSEDLSIEQSVPVH